MTAEGVSRIARVVADTVERDEAASPSLPGSAPAAAK
jgi:hypothetical protein